MNTMSTTLRARPVRRRTRRAVTAGVAVAAVLGGLAVAIPGLAAGPAAAAVTVDPAKNPHYFGPWPNWALSQLTTTHATVNIAGAGTGAEATADVAYDGTISGITVTNPGKGYDASTTVTVTGGSTDATGTATVSDTGGVVAYAVDGPGAGYHEFSVTVAGDGAGATAQASGGVDAVAVTAGGSGYTMPVVEFDLPDDPNGVQATGHAVLATDGSGVVTEVVVDNPGSGYYLAPGVTVHNGTPNDPLLGNTPATATSTLSLLAVDPVDVGTGYTAAPTVTVDDVTTGTAGLGATATATTDVGAITGITVAQGDEGAGFLTPGIKKFQDALPMTCDPAAGGCPTAAQVAAGAKFIPSAVPVEKTYSGEAADEYVIGVVQYRTRFSSSLEPTLVRGYVQLETQDLLDQHTGASQGVPLFNELMDGTKVPVKDANGAQYLGVTSPQWLGPFINAQKDKPVRVVFRNLLPNGKDGDLFLPVDSTMMGSGMGPMQMGTPADDKTVTDGIRNPECTDLGKSTNHCFPENRALLHLHGGMTPWISDGTPHQWISPAGESTAWPQGVGVSNVPDMTDSNGAALCEANNDGCQTFYYTNEQSARLMWYHDHSWGITRLNVYAGEAAGYTITDATEAKLVNDKVIPGPNETLPLIVQDRTFVPDDTQLKDVVGPDGKVLSYGQDPTWDATRWGTKGSFWYHHVYMPAQNPGDPSGMSAYGRWMYGPWFWPPATGTKYGPIANPYYDPSCNLDVPSTWQYQTDPFCEPAQIPGTPNLSAGMEQFNDTPLVNGVAYPTLTVEPKAYRLRILNAANDRFFNLQWYLADSTQGDGTTEVALKPAELAAAQTDPNVVPTPVGSNNNAYGPDWVQIANESGFLPAPTTIDGQQPTTWITDPTRFDVGNVDKHSMLLAPAERSDSVVDFSKFAGKTLILYNDAPAAFPARVPSYDYYTGAPDMSPNGAPKIMPGYGPNTRTVMQVRIAKTVSTPGITFSLTKLNAAFRHNSTGTGVFESGQNPTIVGQAAYNSAYGTSFAASGNCNAPSASATTACDGFLRVSDGTVPTTDPVTGKTRYTWAFNTLKAPTSKMAMDIQPKAIHDEMNSSTFDEFGRMQANLGLEAQPPTPGQQNVTLYPYVNPPTEIIDGTNLESAGIKATPISRADDGSQIWRITHNGVDTHPIHFHLYDVQVLNRVTWDNIIIPPDANELGWKDTVRTSPLEDTIVALRPQVPRTPFEVPNSVRPLNPMMPLGDTSMFNSVAPNGTPSAAITNAVVNFGWEYVFHCHILSHEEMDMMRPVTLALPPRTADQLTAQKVTVDGTERWEVGWTDNSITETSFELQRSEDGTTWTTVATVDSPLNQVNTHGARTAVDPTSDVTQLTWKYRVVAKNTVGYGGDFPTTTVQSVSAEYQVGSEPAPLAPTGLTAALATGPAVDLSWTDASGNETGFVVERAPTGSGTWTQVGTTAANATSLTDTAVAALAPGTFDYRVGATNAGGTTWSTPTTIAVVPPTAPSGLTAVLSSGPAGTLTWTDQSTNETGFRIDRAPTGTTTWAQVGTVAANITQFVDTTIAAGSTYDYRVVAVNQVGETASGTATLAVLMPAVATGLAGTLAAGPSVDLAWTDNATDETSYSLQRSNDGTTWTTIQNLAPNAASAKDSTGLLIGATYYYRVGVTNFVGTSYTPATSVLVALANAPTGLTATLQAATVTNGAQVNLAWTDNATNESGTLLQRSTDGGATWTTLTTIAATATTGARTASDLAPLPGTTLVYRVGAANVLGFAWSGTAQVTLLPLPAAPSNLATLLQAGPRVRITWTDASTNEAGFSVQRSADGGATWVQLATRGAQLGTGTNLAYTDQTVAVGTTYQYRVGARNTSGYVYAGPLTVAVAAPAAADPTAVATATSATRQRIDVTWSAVPDVTGYTVQWGTNGTTASGSANVTATTTTRQITNLTRRVWYVRVGSRNAVGTTWSAWKAVPAA